MKEGWALKVTLQFAMGGLVAYKPAGYEEKKQVSEPFWGLGRCKFLNPRVVTKLLNCFVIVIIIYYNPLSSDGQWGS